MLQQLIINTKKTFFYKYNQQMHCVSNKKYVSWKGGKK